MGNRETHRPAIPQPREDNILEVLNLLKERIEIANKERGDPLDGYVSYRDLIDGGLAAQGGLLSGLGGNAGLGGPFTGDRERDIPGPGSQFLRPIDWTNLILPGRPQNVRTCPAWDAIIVKWDWPDDVPNNTYWSRAIIWASATPSFDNAVIVGYSTVNHFVHDGIGLSAPEIPNVETQPGVRYYWVAWQGRADPETGERSESESTPYKWQDGIRGKTAIDPEYALNILEGQITETALFSDLSERIDLIDHDENGNQIYFEPVQTRIIAANAETKDEVFVAIAETARTGPNGGEYYVRIDAGGYVVGFGLSAFTNMDGEGASVNDSAFIIRANKFAVVRPTANAGEGGEIPFIVGEIDGESAVGINGQLIVDGTITAQAIQAGSIGAAQINSQEIRTEVFVANNIIGGSIATNPAPNFRVEINGFGTSRENFPIWFGQGVTGNVSQPGSQPLFFVDFDGSVADLKLSGDMYITGAGNFFAGNFEGGEYYLQLGNPTSDFMIWAGRGAPVFSNDDYVFWIDNEGNASFKGDVEARFVSGEISRTSIIREFYPTITLPPSNAQNVVDVPETAWATVGEFELPAPVFDVGHIPYINCSYSLFGLGAEAGFVRIQFDPNPDSVPGGPTPGWRNILRTTASIDSYGEEKTVQGIWQGGAGNERVHQRSVFRIQMCGYGGFTPQNNHLIGVCLGIR